MRDLIRAICLVLILSLSAGVSHARTEHPMFLNFEPSEYRSANQNWNIAQGADGFIYVTNHKCLMRFNGITWDRFYPFGESNPEVIRSISANAETGRIYVGSYDKFGYYSPVDEFGELKFTLLSDKVEGPLGNNLWSICPVGNKVLFLFFSAWYLYDPATDAISKGRVTWKRSFVWNGDLYVSDDTHVKRWDKDKESFVPAFNRNFPSTVLAIWGRNEDEASAITEASGIIAANRSDKSRPSLSYEEFQGGWPTINRANIFNCDDNPLFQTFCEGIEAYRFDVADGDYKVTLHFIEPNKPGRTESLVYNLSSETPVEVKAGKRVFSILANSEEVVPHLDLAGDYGHLTAVTITFDVHAREGNGVVISFVPEAGKTILSGIEIERKNRSVL